MGLPSSTPRSRCPDYLAGNNRMLSFQPNFYNMSHCKQMLLSSFRGKLLERECAYVLATLIQQYFSMLRNGNQVIISDKLCKVTANGLLLVSKGEEKSLKLRSTRNYIFTFTTIVKVVCRLSVQETALLQSSLGFLLDRLQSIIQLQTNQEIMQKQLFRQITNYLQSYKVPWNLGAAVAREAQLGCAKLKQQHPVHLKNGSKHLSYGDFSSAYKQTFDHQGSSKQTESLHWHNSRDKSWLFSTSQYSYKFAHQNQANYQYSDIRSSFNTCILPQLKVEKKSKSHRLSLTAQYSLNLVLKTPKEQNGQLKSVRESSFRKKRLATVKMRQSCSRQPTAKFQLHKNNTSINFDSDNRQKAERRRSHNRVKTVLDTMARLVEVREESSSKSIIY